MDGWRLRCSRGEIQSDFEIDIATRQGRHPDFPENPGGARLLKSPIRPEKLIIPRPFTFEGSDGNASLTL